MYIYYMYKYKYLPLVLVVVYKPDELAKGCVRDVQGLQTTSASPIVVDEELYMYIIGEQKLILHNINVEIENLLEKFKNTHVPNVHVHR